MAQLVLFTSLHTVHKLSEKIDGNERFKDLEDVFLNSLLDWYMMMFGDNPNRMVVEVDTIEWVLLIGFTFLVNIVNLNLLISIIGDTFEKVQST